jgi:hypothetical protein
LKLSPLVSLDVLDSVKEELLKEGLTINKDAKDFLEPALKLYERKVIVPDELPLINLHEIITTGCFLGQNHLAFWKSVVENKISDSPFLASLVPVAALMLAQPAAEAVDESSFSSAGQILTKHRVMMSPVTMEQATIIKVFLRRKGFSPQAFDAWYNQKKKTFMEEKARKKKEKAEMKAAQPKK